MASLMQSGEHGEDKMKKRYLTALAFLLLAPILGCDNSDITAPEDMLILLSADPAYLSPSGQPPDPEYGETVVTARAVDSAFEPVKGIGIIFSATPLGDNGGLASGGSPVKTDSGGIARDVLKNDRGTAVTARSKDITAELDIEFVFDNIKPQARATAAPNPALVDQWVAFDGTASRDTDGAIVNYRWEFWQDQVCDPETEPARPGSIPDETTEGIDKYVVVRKFDHEQQVIVMLTVTDNLGAEDSAGICETIVTSLP